MEEAPVEERRLNLAPVFDIPESTIASLIGSSEGIGAALSDPNNRSQTYYTAAKIDSGFGKDDYRTLVELCRNIFKDEGLVKQWVMLQMGMASMGMENKFKREVADRHRQVFNGFAARVNENIVGKTAGLDEFQRRFCYEYYTSGMVCTLETVAPMKIGVGGRGVPFKVPVEMTILDPLRVDLDKLYSEGVIYYELTQAEVDEIKKNKAKSIFVQVYPKSGSVEKSPSPVTPTIYSQADIIKIVVDDNKTSVPLPTGRYRLYRCVYDDYTLYPTPFLSSTLVALGDKSMLRESDRSVMRKLINMILHYKIGVYNLDGKLTNAGETTVTGVRSTFSENLRRSKDGRLLVHFSPDTHDMKWLVPSTDALLDQDKYHTANIELMASLCGPAAWGVVSDSGSINFDLLMKIIWMQYEMFANVYKRFIENIYGDIIKNNAMNFTPTSVKLKQRRISMMEMEQFQTLKLALAQKGFLSAKTLIEEAGEFFDDEIENQIAEELLREQNPGVLSPQATFKQLAVPANDASAPASTTAPKKPRATKSGDSPGAPTTADKALNNNSS